MKAKIANKQEFKKYFHGRSYEAFQFMNEYLRVSGNVATEVRADSKIISEHQGERLRAIGKEALKKAFKVGLLSGVAGTGAWYATHYIAGLVQHSLGINPSAEGQTSSSGSPSSDTTPSTPRGVVPVPTGPDATQGAAAPIVPPASEAIIPHEHPSGHIEWRENRLFIDERTGFFHEARPGEDPSIYRSEVIVEGQHGATAEQVAKVITHDIRYSTDHHFLSGYTPEQQAELQKALSGRITELLKQAHQPATFEHGTVVRIPASVLNDAIKDLTNQGHPIDMSVDHASGFYEGATDTNIDQAPLTPSAPAAPLTPNAPVNPDTNHFDFYSFLKQSLSKPDVRNTAIALASLPPIVLLGRKVLANRHEAAVLPLLDLARTQTPENINELDKRIEAISNLSGTVKQIERANRSQKNILQKEASRPENLWMKDLKDVPDEELPQKMEQAIDLRIASIPVDVMDSKMTKEYKALKVRYMAIAHQIRNTTILLGRLKEAQAKREAKVKRDDKIEEVEEEENLEPEII
jgi:hypothetical protein